MKLNKKSGMSMVVMLGSMAIIASIFGYFVCSWFLDYVTAPQQGVESVAKEEIIKEQKVDDSKETVQKSGAELSKEDEKEGEEKEEATIGQPLDQDLFTVQVGAFSKQENAQGLVSQLQNKGFTAYVTSENPYRVQVGAFRTEDAAQELGVELENNGFPVYISN